ncbi:Histidine phosphatase superfamily (branch 1) [Tepidimonas alkaliphilus]|uniref:Histidine phosphatase superfamily (Branch 1) n=1 Tax=Tepidimonas alkaliphilus TaxID=2588942 RepID=A0A554W957_9BURK|nr:histidine phosphatase family protein [Tepidimonas alkaliphilus]TSE20110.1 Histidine phosphatase superfamily (branch 1) [Tepidimonas alkaliphilus]
MPLSWFAAEWRPAARTLAAAMLTALLPVAAARASDAEALWQALATRPNMVVVMRHTEASGRDGSVFDPSGQCRGENMLTGKGRRDAEAIGRAFAARGLPPERLHVVASAMCRTRDTARLAFGKAELDARLREFLSGRGGSLNEAMDAAEGWIRRLRGPNPLVLVTHLPNIDALTGEQIDYNEAIVTESDEQGQLKVLGVLRLLP